MDELMMRRAIHLAQATHPHPNPRVGAVLIDGEGRVTGEGAHQGPGMAHAEVLAMSGGAGPDHTLYVSLEPCSHHGRTPPCVDAILAAGVGRVVVGRSDPDDRVDGRGIQGLRQAGVTVEVGVLADEVEALDPGYFHHRRTGRPRVTLKLALTLDGQLAASDRSSRWVTSEEARADGHRLRAESDAIMIGAGTVRHDDPLLSVRVPDTTDVPGTRPVIVAGRRPIPPQARLLDRNPLILSPQPLAGIRGGQVIVVPDESGERVDLEKALAELGRLEIIDLLVEGGSALAGALWERNLIDRGILYLAAKLAGGPGLAALGGTFPTIGAARPVTIQQVARVGPDLRVEFSPEA